MSKRSIVLINLKPPYELKASTMRLASPDRTSTIQQILVASETELFSFDMIEQEENNVTDEQKEPTKLPCTTESFSDIFNHSHTVILPDSMFVEKSRIFNHTQAFVQHGVPALQAFYQSGGTVLIQCVEGALSSSCTAQMNTIFGTDWKIHVLADTISLGPTPLATRLFESPYLPQQIVIKNSAFFLSCPEGEGLYQVLLPTREEFVKSFEEQDEVFERLGIEKDSSMETFHCFDVDKSWDDYQKKYSDRYGLALHAADKGGGHVIWYGDRSQTNKTMSFIFCKLLAIGHLGRENEEAFDDEYAAIKRQLPLPNGPVMMAIMIVLLAILAKLWGL